MNRITALFNVKYPIIQAGMIWCSGWKLASAVCNSGGLGDVYKRQPLIWAIDRLLFNDHWSLNLYRTKPPTMKLVDLSFKSNMKFLLVFLYRQFHQDNLMHLPWHQYPSCTELLYLSLERLVLIQRLYVQKLFSTLQR